MVKGIYLLLEILTILVCLFWLFGRELKFTHRMLSVIIIHIGLFIVCGYVGYNGIFSLVLYAVIAEYAVIEFGKPMHETVIKVVIMILLCAAVQTLAATGLEALHHGMTETESGHLCVNVLAFTMAFVLYRKVDLQGTAAYIKGEYSGGKYLLSSIFGMAAFYILCAKEKAGIDEADYLLFFVMAIIIVFLIGTWEKYRIQIQEKKIEIEVHEIYAESYKKLIDEIRIRQHEFDNHLQSILNQQYTCHTYEELVSAQSKYMEALSVDHRYNKLLRQGNSVYIGFLYGKLASLEKQGIRVGYKVNIGSLKSDMPVYKLIEITNDLLTNACEAISGSHTVAASVSDTVPESICLWIDETEDVIFLEVRNLGDPLSMDFIGECFKKGYSRKGAGRGLGLYNVKRISDQYSASIECKNVDIDKENWISFSLKIPKPIISDRP